MRLPPIGVLSAALIACAGHATALDYATCIAMIDRDPVAAENAALRWAREGGGDAAEHCAAMALAAQGAWDAAALRLADLAARPGDAPTETRAAMLVQAAGFWRRDGRLSLARAALDEALDADPRNAEALVARADLSASEGHLSAAAADVAAARAVAPSDPAPLVLGAALKRASGDAGGALTEADAALRLAPRDAAALFERGSALAALGRREAAREAWLAAIAVDRDGPDAERARLALQDMEAR